MKNKVSQTVINKKGRRNFQFDFDRSNLRETREVVIVALESGDYQIKLKINHRQSKVGGRVLVRAVVGNGASLLVEGLIKVKKGLRKIDSSLEMRSLVLDKRVKVEMKPNLEVEANEVRIAHQATVTELDEEQIFYLMSRGLDRKQAKGLLVRGFLGSDREWRKIEACLR
jgi:Fe-S cluster assembly scaffold protein SufB